MLIKSKARIVWQWLWRLLGCERLFFAVCGAGMCGAGMCSQRVPRTAGTVAPLIGVDLCIHVVGARKSASVLTQYSCLQS